MDKLYWWHFNFIVNYGTSSIKDGVCCLMGFYFKGCNPHWTRFMFVFFLTLDCKLVTSLSWYWKQAIEITFALLKACNSCSLLYMTSTLPNILRCKQHTVILFLCLFICSSVQSHTFSKLQEVAISSVMCVHPSLHMEQLGSHWMNLTKFDIWGFLKFIHSFISIQPWRPGLAGTRAQSCDRYGSGTLQSGQVLGGRLPLLSPAFRRSHFSRQVPPSATTREILAAKGGSVGEKDVR